MSARRTRLSICTLEDRTVLTTFVVTTAADAGPGSLRECVLQANAAPDPDTIVFAPSLDRTLIGLSTVGDTSAGPAALLVSAPVSIQGTGQTLLRAGTAAMRLFTVTAVGNLSLDALTLTGGVAQGGDGGANGGGGAAGLGGAVFNLGRLTVTACTLTGNTAVGGAGGSGAGAGRGGGGLATAAGATGAGGGPNGGSVFSTPGGFITIAAGFGGGGAGNVLGNVSGGGFGGGGGGGSGSFLRPGGAGGFGGGGGGGGGGRAGSIDSFPGPGTPGGAGGFGAGSGTAGQFGGRWTPGANGAGGGGGAMGGVVFNDGGTVVVVNSTLTANGVTPGGSGATAGKGYGGAIFSRNGSLTMRFSTVSANTAADGGAGMYVLTDAVASPGDLVATGTAAVALFDCILGQASAALADLTTATSGAASPASATGANNLIRSTTVAGVGNRSSADPRLGPLRDNGGPAPTMAPLAGSPAVDAAGPADAADLLTDQRGAGFVRVSGRAADLGAFEVQRVRDVVLTAGDNETLLTELPGDNRGQGRRVGSAARTAAGQVERPLPAKRADTRRVFSMTATGPFGRTWDM